MIAIERVRQLMQFVVRIPPSDCWIWNGCLNADGYGRPSFNGKAVYAHRLFYAAFQGKLRARDCVLHKCDVRACVNPAHLFKGSRRANLLDMWAKGRGRPGHVFGEAHGCAKLDEETVRLIRSDQRSGVKLSAELGVCRSTIYAIRNKKKWAHVV